MNSSGGKRVLAIGDIHGCSRALETLLAVVDPQGDDRVITLGDVVDRGPDSYSVIECLLRLRRKCDMVNLRGNHELMMLWARQDSGEHRAWRACGGEEALASYGRGGKPGTLSDVPDHHWEFIERQCVAWYETDTHFFVHANVHPETPLEEQPDYMLYWEVFERRPRHVSGKIMVCGHTEQHSGLPRNLGHAVCIDTWAYGGGWLTCLDITSGRIWQANQAGEHRTVWLDDLLERDHFSD